MENNDLSSSLTDSPSSGANATLGSEDRASNATDKVQPGPNATVQKGENTTRLQQETLRKRQLKENPDSTTLTEDTTQSSRDLEKQGLEQSTTKAEDEGNSNSNNNVPDPDEVIVIWWDGPDDPANPYNWSSTRKLTNCALISALTFVTPLASSIFAPGVPELMIDFRSTNELLAAFVVSVYVLGFAFGPLLMAPLSEMYGRVPVYHACNVLFVVFVVGCALAPSLDVLIAFRFLSGCVGAAPLTNGGGSIADMISQERRGGAMAAFSIGPLIGPVIGPVIGGFLQEAKGWRWVFWVLAIIAGSLTVLIILFMRETYAPVLLQRKVKRLQRQTGNMRMRSKLDRGGSAADLFKRSIIRPLKLLVFSPICTVFALYMAMVYGYLYLLFTSVPYVFEGFYVFKTSDIGLVYVGLGVGSFIGLAWFTADTTRAIKKALQQQAQAQVDGSGSGSAKPEVRLRLLPIAAIILPLGFFLYGWTAEHRAHWIVPILGLCVIGVGNLICFMAISVYLVDAYTIYAASALAANTVMRSVAGAVLPLCALKMYEALGLGWGNSLLGFIAFAMLPIPFLVLRYGERLREKFDLSRL